MSTVVNRATFLAFAGATAVSALVVALIAGPLDDPGPSTARIQARLMAVDPPQLWRAQSLGADGRPTATTYVCADTPLASTFARALAEVNGEPCLAKGADVLRPDLFAARCQAFGRPFAVTAATRGDLRRDFRMDFQLAALDVPGVIARQALSYHRLGGCPAGWRIGDQARSPAPR